LKNRGMRLTSSAKAGSELKALCRRELLRAI